MTADPVTIQPEASVETVVKVLEANQVSGLPVVDAAGKVIGIISEGDLLYQEAPMQPPLYLTFLGSVIYFESPDKFHQHIKKSLGMLVKDVMTPHPVTTTPDTPIAEVAQLMLEKRLRRLPVIDQNQKLVGIITRHDLIRALRTE